MPIYAMHRAVVIPAVMNILKQGGVAVCSENTRRAYSSFSPEELAERYPHKLPTVEQICDECKHGSPKEKLVLRMFGDMRYLVRGKDPREELANVPSSTNNESFLRSLKDVSDGYQQSECIALFKPHKHYPEIINSISAYWKEERADGRVFEAARRVEPPEAGGERLLQDKLGLIGYPNAKPGMVVPLILYNGHDEANGTAMHVPRDFVFKCDPIRVYPKLAELMEQFMHSLSYENGTGTCRVAKITVPRFGPLISKWRVASWEKRVFELLMGDSQEQALGQQMLEEEGPMVKDIVKEIEKLEEEQEKRKIKSAREAVLLSP